MGRAGADRPDLWPPGLIAMMPYSLRFPFADLPLATAQDKSGAVWNLEITADGAAVIDYDAAGEWLIDDIEIFTSRLCPTTRRWQSSVTTLDGKSTLFGLVSEALTVQSRDEISERVTAALAEEGIRERSDSEEHGTLHRAAQGV
jgi:hypothetical protein